jgi:predicted esterase
MSRWWGIGVILGAWVAASPATAGSNACYGPKSAKHGVIYFHGLDQPGVGSQEKTNRRLLSTLAGQLKIRIAVPRANERCRQGLLCWPHQSAKEINKTLEQVQTQVKTCLDKRPVKGFIGFSNGGYLINKAFQLCRSDDKARAFLVIGAAGDLKRSPKKLSQCGQLTLAIGRNDQIHRRVEQLAGRLKKRYQDHITFKTFPAAHVLHAGTVKAWLQRHTQPPQKKQRHKP